MAPAASVLQAAIVPAAAAVPPLPSWARETNALASYAGGRNMMFMYNQKLVADANATGTMYDVAFMGGCAVGCSRRGLGPAHTSALKRMDGWQPGAATERCSALEQPPCERGVPALPLPCHAGDSVIAYTVVVPAVAAVWDRFWAPSTGLKAARLGVGCSTVEELVVR